MGQARVKELRRREAMGQAIVLQSERWARPGSALEARWLAEVEAMPHVPVFAQRREAMLAGGMVYAQCHMNCASVALNDPMAKHVLGWWQQGDTYVLHSVIEQAGDLYCVTPQHMDIQGFMFVRDPKLQWVTDQGPAPVILREGMECLDGLRRDPERFKLVHELLQQKVAAGLTPFDAMAEITAEIGPL